MKNILLCFGNDSLWIGRGDEPPGAFICKGESFSRSTEGFSDCDYLRSEAGEVCGFFSTLDDAEEVVKYPSFSKNKHVKIDPLNGCFILLSSSKIKEIECVQVIGTRVYIGHQGSIIMVFPDWGIDKFGFAQPPSHFSDGELFLETSSSPETDTEKVVGAFLRAEGVGATIADELHKPTIAPEVPSKSTSK